MILQSGTTPRKRTHFKEAMAHAPRAIYAFPRATGLFDKVLMQEDGTTLKSGVQPVFLNDPTEVDPWGEEQVRIFKSVVTDAAHLVREGSNVLFLCVGGKNRSRAAALATAGLAGVDANHLDAPEDKGCFEALIGAIVDQDDAALAKCTPVKPRKVLRGKDKEEGHANDDKEPDGAARSRAAAKRKATEEMRERIYQMQKEKTRWRGCLAAPVRCVARDMIRDNDHDD